MVIPFNGRLGELERAVMDHLWDICDADPAATVTVRDLHQALEADRRLAYTTVMTVLDRLARKDLVVQERDGRAYRYRARAGRAAMTAALMHDALEDFAHDDRRTALVAFVDVASPDELEALRQALDRVRGS